MNSENRFFEVFTSWKEEEFRLQALNKLNEDLGEATSSLYKAHEENKLSENALFAKSKSLMHDYRATEAYINKAFELE